MCVKRPAEGLTDSRLLFWAVSISLAWDRRVVCTPTIIPPTQYSPFLPRNSCKMLNTGKLETCSDAFWDLTFIKGSCSLGTFHRFIMLTWKTTNGRHIFSFKHWLRIIIWQWWYCYDHRSEANLPVVDGVRPFPDNSTHIHTVYLYTHSFLSCCRECVVSACRAIQHSVSNTFL